MRVNLIEIPKESLINNRFAKLDFEECLSLNFETTKTLNIDDVVFKSFETFSINWINFLFKLRDKLVKPFKLVSEPDVSGIHKQIKPIKKSNKIGFFEVKDLNTEEVLMYGKDKHLEVYFCITLIQNGDQKTINASTIVKLLNRFGKVYFAVIKPFHVLIIKTMLRKTSINLSKS